jgi:hypothetical protein
MINISGLEKNNPATKFTKLIELERGGGEKSVIHRVINKKPTGNGGLHFIPKTVSI